MAKQGRKSWKKKKYPQKSCNHKLLKTVEDVIHVASGGNELQFLTDYLNGRTRSKLKQQLSHNLE